MPHQNNLTLQTVDCGLCKGDVFGKGFGRVLHDSDVVTLFLEHAVNTRPSRAVYDPAVNKHNCFARFALLLIRSLHIYNDCLSIINLFLVGDWLCQSAATHGFGIATTPYRVLIVMRNRALRAP